MRTDLVIICILMCETVINPGSPGSIDHDELFKLLSKLGVEVDEKVVNNAMITYDLDGQGSLEMAEFLQFLRAQHDEAISRLREMAECPIMCLASNPTVRYIPPRRGVLHLTVTDSFQTSSTQRVLSSFDYNNILKLIKNSGLDVAESFVMALKNMKLRQAEATKVFAHMYAENRDKSKCLGVLLPLMLDSKEARGVVDELIGDDDVEMNKLTSLIGSAIKPILGFYDGFYDLDLARETDRVCVLQLLNRSQDVLEKRKKMYEDVFGNGMIGDCSQKQNWSAFRNEYFNGSDFIITPAMFTPMPTSGKICFDFVASDHPPNSVTSFSDRRCISCLITMGLIDEKDRSRAQDMLNTWREYGIVTSSGKGEELPMADYARAYSIQQFSNKFRMSLKERSEQMAKAIQREDVFAYKQRQAKLAAKRNNYNRQRNSGILKPVISQRKASTRDIRRKQSIRKPSRALTRVGGTDSAQLVASIKEFQALASPDIDGLGQVDEDEEHSDGTSSDEDDYYDEAEGSTITSLTQPPIPGGVSKPIRGLSLQPIGENKTATTISDRSHSRAGSVVSSPLTTGTSCPLDYMYRGLCSNGPARNSLPGITPRSSAIEGIVCGALFTCADTSMWTQQSPLRLFGASIRTPLSIRMTMPT